MKLNTKVNCDLWCPLVCADLGGRFVWIFGIFCKGQAHPGLSDVDNEMRQFLVWPRKLQPHHQSGWPTLSTGEYAHKNDELRSLYRTIYIYLLSQRSSTAKTETRQSENSDLWETHAYDGWKSNKQHIMLFANINNVNVAVVTFSPSVDKYLVYTRRAHFLLHCFTIAFNATTCTQRSVISENFLQLDQLITQYLLHSINCGINAWTTYITTFC